MALVSIVLINYFKYEDTLECLDSLAESTFDDFEVIVVDNHSTNDSIIKIQEYLKSSKLDVKLIELEKNLGFSTANNVGVEHACQDSKYVFILNNDTIVEKNCIGCLVQGFLDDPKLFAVTGKAYYYSNKDVLWWAGKHPHVFLRSKKMINILNKDRGRFNKPRKIPFITGAFLFANKKIYVERFSLDNDFFFGVEDYELGKRVKKAGYYMMYLPNAIIWHKVGQTRSFSGKQLFSNYASFILGIKKTTSSTRIASFRIWFYKARLMLTLPIRYFVKRGINVKYKHFKSMINYSFDYMKTKSSITENDLNKALDYYNSL